ncbi:MAG: DUF523 domain-containing protein [Peptostreptococcaceae bacterium]|jgi:uncharacterized protein YbbK (DUF523 family)|nr:DUF523 domain-containing protein [Peptostreptococcaceae bacterium]
MKKTLVSACLLGIDCKYSGENNKNEELLEFLKGKDIIPICPEQLGGLKTPRQMAELKSTAKDIVENEGIVITKDNVDVTKEFLKGGYEILKYLKLFDIEKAILKEGSPSCGSNFVYDGSFSSKKIKGQGITAYLLQKEGVKLFSENNFMEA